MQENNESKQVANAAEVSTGTSVTSESTTAATPQARRSYLRYVAVVAIILAMAAALLYALERQGRVSTGLFGDVAGGQAVAYVNGEKITRRDHDNNVNQLLQMATAQGIDTTDAAAVAELRTQALDTLINGELLRQAALEAGMAATAEAIDARYEQISNDLGGEEQLQIKMAEFGITTALLRRDIENEILIQGLFDARFPVTGVAVTDEEAKMFYDQIAAGAEDAPAFEDLKDQIIEQIKRDRQQLEVSNLIDSLRSEATIETLI